MSKNYTPKNEWELQYEREYKRITQAIRRQQKQGYHVPKNIRPTSPSKVKVMSPLEVEKLIKLTPNEIRKKSVLISEETGESNNGINNANNDRIGKPSSSQKIELSHRLKVKKLKTELEEQYAREYIRVRNAIKRQEKLGYSVPESLRPIPPSKLYLISPDDVQRLIGLTPKEIRKNSVWIDPETGAEYPGFDIVEYNRKNKREKKKKKDEPKNTAPPKESNLNIQIIDTINLLLAEWQPAPYWHASFLERKHRNFNMINTLWNETLNKEGEYEVAYRLESNATEFIRLVERLLYSSDSTVEDDFNMGRFIELLINRPLTAEESDEYTEIAREAAMDSLRGENSIV